MSIAAVLFCGSIFLVSCFLSVTVFTATFHLFFYVSLLVHSLTFRLNFSWSGYLLELYNQRKEPVFQVVETSLYDRVVCFTSPKPIKTCLAEPLTVHILPPPYHQDRLLLPAFPGMRSVWVICLGFHCLTCALLFCQTGSGTVCGMAFCTSEGHSPWAQGSAGLVCKLPV